MANWRTIISSWPDHWYSRSGKKGMFTLMNVGLDVCGFSGHETFPFRYSWLKKGVDAATGAEDPFNQDDALVRLGVGKNMVRSIRHWCLTTGLLEEQRTGAKRTLSVSSLGQYLFGDDGQDPYLEDSATLWLLHWKIATNRRRATTWFWVYSFWHHAEFRKEWLVQRLAEVADVQGWHRISASSIARDVDCFVRTYVPARASKTLLLEDTLDCPLVELGLIEELPDRRTYRLVRGDKPTLPDAIFAYAVVDYWQCVAARGTTLPFDDLFHGPGSPGRVFLMDENSLVERLERLERITGGCYTYAESAGIKQLMRSDEHPNLMELLRLYYESLGD